MDSILRPLGACAWPRCVVGRLLRRDWWEYCGQHHYHGPSADAEKCDGVQSGGGLAGVLLFKSLAAVQGGPRSVWPRQVFDGHCGMIKTTPKQIDLWRKAPSEDEHLEFKAATNHFDYKALVLC